MREIRADPMQNAGRTYEPAPAGALDGGRGGVELLLELVESAEGLKDGSLERTVLEDATVAAALRRGGREVLPEERVIDVPCALSLSHIRASGK